MSRFFKQKGKIGRLIAPCLLLAGVFTAPLPAQTAFQQWEKGTLQLKMAPEIRNMLEPTYSALETGTQRLLALLGQKPVSRPLTMWLVKTEAQRDEVLVGLGYPAAQKGTRAARYADQIVLVVSPTTPREWFVRFILTEYARYIVLMDAVQDDGMDWLRTGMAISLGWFVAEELEKGNWASANTKLIQYYTSQLKRNPDITFDALRAPGYNWRRFLQQKDKGQLISRAALLYAWTAQKQGPATGISVLNLWTREKNMGNVLSRGADITLDELSAKLADADKSAPK